MFRLHYLKLKKHPVLGDLYLNFLDQENLGDEGEPFTSVLIGTNGTGKSYILKVLGDLFFQISQFKKLNKRENIPFIFHIRYSINSKTFDVFSSTLIFSAHAQINLPDVANIYALEGRSELDSTMKEYFLSGSFEANKIPFEKLELPFRVIASSTQLNDRFTFKKWEESEVYKYCGVKRTPRSIYTNTFTRSIADSLVSIPKNDCEAILTNALSNYLNFDKHLKVTYRTKYTSTFFDGEATLEKLEDLFIHYERTRSRKTKPWGTWKYIQLKEAHDVEITKDKSEKSKLLKIIDTMNSLAQNGDLEKVKRSDSKRIAIDYFKIKTFKYDPIIIHELLQMDLVQLESIVLKKGGKLISSDKMSAGEIQIILSFLVILSQIKENSLVLIDEPEISLHPNWQMKYIHLLKNMFKQYSNSHFILATHSHFLISDLKPESSSVISLKRDFDNILHANNINADTYGWSAEEILYKVFGMKTTRNYYLEVELRELLHGIATNSQNKVRLREILNQLVLMEFTRNDPLNIVIERAKNYLND